MALPNPAAVRLLRKYRPSRVLVIGVGVGRVRLDQPFFHVASEPETQLVEDLVRDLVLQLENPRRSPADLSAPQLRPVVDVHELRSDDQCFTALKDSTGEDGTYAEIASDYKRIDVWPFVAEHGTASHDAQLRHLRQVVDDRVGDPVAEGIAVRILAGIDKREDRDRIDRLRETPALDGHGLAVRRARHGSSDNPPHRLEIGHQIVDRDVAILFGLPQRALDDAGERIRDRSDAR